MASNNIEVENTLNKMRKAILSDDLYDNYLQFLVGDFDYFSVSMGIRFYTVLGNIDGNNLITCLRPLI